MSIKGRGLARTLAPSDKAMVYEMLVDGKGLLEIAEHLNCTVPMLKKRCNDEIIMAKAEIIARGGYVKPSQTFEITPDQRFQIRKMAGLGLTYEQISVIMGMSRSHLVDYCQDDLNIGKAEAVNEVAGVLYDMATDKAHPTETKFYLKAQAGWREATSIEFPDGQGNLQPPGGAVHVSISAENMQTMIALLNEKV